MNVNREGKQVVIEVPWDAETKHNSVVFLHDLDKLLTEVWYNGSVPKYIKDIAAPLRKKVRGTHEWVKETSTKVEPK